MTKKLLALLLAAVCFTLCLCGCEQPAAEPSGVLRAGYWSRAPKIYSVEEILSWYDLSLQNVVVPSSSLCEIVEMPLPVYAYSYQEYLEKIKPSLRDNIDVFWEDVEVLGHIDVCSSTSFSVTLSEENHSDKLHIRVNDGTRVAVYNHAVADNIIREYYGYSPEPLPTQWIEITTIDNQNPMRLPQHMQAELVQGQDARYSYYTTLAGFHLYYVNDRLTSICGFRGNRGVEFEWEGDYATMEDIPFDTLRQLIELATRPV